MESKLSGRESKDTLTRTIDMDRISSGIQGFDELVEGGLIKDRVYLVSGSSGSGKTIFSMQFIYNGITQFKENGVYVTFEETPEQLRRDMSALKWELRPLEEAGKLALIDATSARVGLGSKEKFVIPRPVTLDSILFEIYKTIQRIGAKRVVIDCLDAMELQTKSPEDFRASLLKLISILKSFNCTSFLVIEAPEKKISRRGVSEFVSDGIICLYYVLEDDRRVRKIEVLKMRGTEHSSRTVPFQIGENGIAVLSESELEKTMRKVGVGAKS